jgi:hypothetical protein
LITNKPKASQSFNQLIISILTKYRVLFFSIFWKVFQLVEKAIILLFSIHASELLPCTHKFVRLNEHLFINPTLGCLCEGGTTWQSHYKRCLQQRVRHCPKHLQSNLCQHVLGFPRSNQLKRRNIFFSEPINTKVIPGGIAGAYQICFSLP